MKRRVSKIYQSGISLLEVLLSLSIIAIILVMATRYYFVASNNDRINIVRQQVGSLIAAVNEWKGQNARYDSTLSVATLYKDGMLAKSTSLVTAGDDANLYDPWGDEITVTGESNSATIAVTLPKMSDCIALQNSYQDASCNGNQSGDFMLVLR